MGKRPMISFILMICLLMMVPNVPEAGGARPGCAPPQLDTSLMGFKEQGVWYFPCVAPVYLYRIPPHVLTVAPPPVPCGPVPCVPAPPRKIR